MPPTLHSRNHPATVPEAHTSTLELYPARAYRESMIGVEERITRRHVVVALAAGLSGGLAGCTGGETTAPQASPGNEDPSTSTTTEPITTEPTDTPSNTPADTPTDSPTDAPTDPPTDTGTATADLDLTEANVVGVTVEQRDDGVRFDVALHHDDDGEDGYANWWQVETRDGERLGRRELLHPHSTQPFTRSTTVQVPDGVDCVVVRGHDETHGYGGQAMLVTPATGATRSVRQGAEPQSMTEASCP